MTAAVPRSASGTEGGARRIGALSDDRLWRWDGHTWQRAEPTPADAVPGESEPSRDGQWLWDGAGWKRVTT